MTWLLGKPAVRLMSEVDSATSPWSLEDLRGGAHDPRRGATVAAPAKTAAQMEAEAREQILAEAYQRGHEDGRTAGEIAEGARLRHAVQAADQAVEEIRENEARWAGTIE
jgi:hypothetical protein